MSTTTRFSSIASAVLFTLISNVALANEEIKAPSLVTCATPTYAEKSIIKDEEGIVKLALRIGVDGKVVDAKVLTSSGFANLDKASLSAVQDCSFTANASDSVWANISFNWILN
jgi:TonB family protein